MSTNFPKELNILLRLAAGAALVWLAVRYALPLLLPFGAAFALAGALEKPVSALEKRAKLPRAAAAGICVIAFAGAGIFILYVLLSRLAEELKSLAAHIPELLEQGRAVLASWEAWLLAHFGGGQPGAFLSGALESLESRAAELPALAAGRALALVTDAAGNAPAALLFTVTMVIGTYFISASFAEVKAFFARQLPERARARVSEFTAGLKGSILKYFKAQLIMSGLICAALLAAFLLMGVNYALVAAVAVSLIDALPVLGTGTVLIPWALYCFMTGQVSRGAALAATYGAVTVLRSCVQAKLLGQELGLDPLATLLAIYAGFRLAGVWGMILFPIGAITLKQLNDGGVVHLWRS